MILGITINSRFIWPYINKLIAIIIRTMQVVVIDLWLEDKAPQICVIKPIIAGTPSNKAMMLGRPIVLIALRVALRSISISVPTWNYLTMDSTRHSFYRRSHSNDSNVPTYSLYALYSS